MIKLPEKSVVLKSNISNASSTNSTLCAQPCYHQTVETHSCVSASCQVFAIGDFIRQSCLPRRKNASLQLFVELTLINVSSTDSTLCAQPCYCQTVETHSCVSASCQVFATGDFIRQSCLPRRKNASLQVFVELTCLVYDLPRSGLGAQVFHACARLPGAAIEVVA